MRLTMISIGSTGDVRPYILLGRELQARGHQITIAAFEPFEDLVRKAGMNFAPLSGSVEKFMGEVMKPGVNGFTFLKHVQQGLGESISELLIDMQKACEDAQGVIGTFFGTAMYSIAEKNRIPCIQTHYFPIDENRSMPISSAPGLNLGKAWNKSSYRIGHLLINSIEKKYLSTWRKSQGMRKRKITTTMDNTINGVPVPTLYALSPALIPRPQEWGNHIYMTGFWLEKECIDDFVPDEKMIAFLKKHSQAIYIGFGSMVSGDMGETLQIVLDALKIAKIPAVLSKGWGGEHLNLGEHPHVFIAEYVPHSWLFSQVSAVVHHGGIGTIAAGLLAGKPTLVVPFGGDQPFWGNRIVKMGLGPKPILRSKLTAEKLAKKLLALTENPEYAKNAKEMQKKLLKEEGIKTAADIIEVKMAEGLKD